MDLEFYKDIINEIPSAYSYQKIILDNKGVPCDFEFIEVNAAFEEYFKLKSYEVIGKRGSELFFGCWFNDADLMKNYGDVALNEESITIKEYSDKLNKWMNMKIYSPKKYYFIVLYHDIARELVESIEIEEFFRIHLDMVCVSDLKGNVIQTNKEWDIMLGYEVPNLMNSNFLEYVHPTDFISTIETVRGLTEKKPIINFVNRCMCKDDKYHYIEWHVQFRNNLFYCTARDITEITEKNRYLEQMVKISQEFLQMSYQDLDYQKITDLFLELSKAKYVQFNIYEEDSLEFTTRSLSGSHEDLQRLEDLLEFTYVGKRSTHDTAQDDRIKSNIITVFTDLYDYVGHILPESYLENISNSFDIGQVVIANIVKDNHKIGNFILFMPKKQELQNNSFISIYAHQVGLLLERSQSEEKVQNLLTENEMIFNGTQDMLFLVSIEEGPSFVYIKNNIAHQENTGFIEEGFVGKSPDELFGPEIGAVLHQNYVRCIQEGKPISYELTIELLSGFRTLKTTLTPVYESNRPSYIVGSCHDITEDKEKLQAIEYLSFHDQLTGVYNRTFFEVQLKHFDTLKHLPLTIVMADVNNLKLTNDAFGHNVGDQLLKRAAEIIQECCRADDVLARIGGDEFVILLSKVSLEGAEKIVERIRKVCSNTFVGSVELSISLGMDTKNYVDQKIQDVQKKAEDHMYRRKLFESMQKRNKIISSFLKILYKSYLNEEDHSKQVSVISKAIGKRLNLSDRELQDLEKAALLHDIGKIGIDHNIINKEGALTFEEELEVKRHPEIGYRILSNVDGFSTIADFVLAHHEHVDGTGYPKGSRNEQIPIQAKIIALADAYDAMTRDRSYRKAFSQDYAVAYILKNAGTHFDPKLVELFLELYSKEMLS